RAASVGGQTRYVDRAAEGRRTRAVGRQRGSAGDGAGEGDVAGAGAQDRRRAERHGVVVELVGGGRDAAAVEGGGAAGVGGQTGHVDGAAERRGARTVGRQRGNAG